MNKRKRCKDCAYVEWDRRWPLVGWAWDLRQAICVHPMRDLIIVNRGQFACAHFEDWRVLAGREEE